MPGYYFKLPNFEDLNTAQQAAVNDDKPIALSGGPGTGKSVVALWRHILNHSREIPINSQLITYTKSLALYLRKCCETQNQNASRYVGSSKKWYYNNTIKFDEIIHDEAQDLPIDFNRNLLNYSNRISYGADNQQLLTSNSRNNDGSFNIKYCSPEEELNQLFNNQIHSLSNNFRNSKRIMKLARQYFINAVIPNEIIDSCLIEGEFPRLLVTGNIAANINNSVLQLVRQYVNDETINTAILVPFVQRNAGVEETATVNYYFNLLQQNNINCSKYTNDMPGINEIKNIHITTYKSAKGLEFDIVILPDFQLVNRAFNVVNWRDFYVGITRAKSSLYLISRTDFPNLTSEGINKLIDRVIL